MTEKIEFYKETRLKQTEVGKIPEEWNVVKLNRFGRLKDGDWILKKYYTSGEVRLLQISDIGVGVFLDISNRFIPYETAKKLNCTFVNPQEDILISRMPDPIGRACFAPKLSYPYIVAVDITIFKLDKNKVDRKFMIYPLNNVRILKEAERLSSGATRQRISRKNLESLKVLIPSKIEEQQKIASILSIVDEAIQKTNEIIQKTQELKKGLMQRLLSRGIGHKEFKDSEIGRIPKEWKVVKLGDAVKMNKYSKDPAKEMPNGVFTYVDIDSIEGGTGKIRKSRKILGEKAPSRARRVIHENDVIMSTVRPYLKAFAIVPKEHHHQICSTGFAVLSCRDIILPHFLLNTLFSDNVITQCNQMMVGGQYPALNQSQVFQLKIPLPLLPEQQKIASILSSVDEKIEKEEQTKEQLEKLKKGLMQILLTGIIRIKVN